RRIAAPRTCARSGSRFESASDSRPTLTTVTTSQIANQEEQKRHVRQRPHLSAAATTTRNPIPTNSTRCLRCTFGVRGSRHGRPSPLKIHVQRHLAGGTERTTRGRGEAAGLIGASGGMRRQDGTLRQAANEDGAGARAADNRGAMSETPAVSKTTHVS